MEALRRRVAQVLLAICLPVGSFAFAQGQEQEPAPEDPQKGTEEQRQSNEEDEFERRLKEIETGLQERVVVTATRVETDLMQTPIAVSVFDQETLDRAGVQNVRDMAQMVPNMDIATINGQSTPVISLRGVRSTNETELGDPSVGVHLDGIYTPRMQGALGLMFDNERVEVLRGPQGTLFGRNSTVGSINIISAKPDLAAFDSRLNLQYGNYNAPELQFMVNKPLSDTWAVRFAGRYHQRDSYLDGYWDPNQYDQRFLDGLIGDPTVIATDSFEGCPNPPCQTRTQHTNWWADDTGDDIYALVPADEDDFYMDAKEWAYRASALWQPQDKKKSLNLSFQHFRSDGSGGIDLVNCEKLRGRPTYELDPATNEPVLDANGDPIPNGVNDCSTMFPKDDTYQAVVNVPGRFFLDIKYLRSQFTWDLKPNLRFIYSAGLEDQNRESQQDMEQSLNAWDQALFFLPGTGSKSWMHEVQFQSQGNKNFNWIVGANFFQETTKTIGYFDNALDEKALFVQPDRSTTAGAIFAQATYSYSDQWHLTIGSRYSDETKEDKGGVTYICNVVNGCAPEIARQTIDFSRRFGRASLAGMPTDFFEDSSRYPTVSRNDNKGSWSHSDWRVGLDYQKNEDTLWYAYLATGFKSGGIGDVFEGTVVDGDFDSNGNPIILSREEIYVATDFDQEEVTTLELGLKQRFLDGKLILRGAYFFQDYEDMQYASVGSIGFTDRLELVRDINGMPVDLDEDGLPDLDWFAQPLFTAYFTQNVPGARIQGVELEYDTRPWQGGRIHGYVSWIDAVITEDWITKWDYDARSYFALDFASASDASNERLQVNLKGNDLPVTPPFKVHVTVDHAFLFEQRKMTIVPWVTAHWEDESYLTVWNVDRHTDDLEFVILDQDIRYTDDKRDAWSMFHAGVSLYWGDWKLELYGYNLTDEVVQWWGGPAEQVTKGSFSTPRTYGLRFNMRI